MPNSKGCIPWNKNVSGYKFTSDRRLHNLTLDALKQDISQGFCMLELQKKWKLSDVTIRKYIRQLPVEYELTEYLSRIALIKSRTGRYGGSAKGWKNPNKGKTYLEIFGSLEKAKQRADKTRAFMLTDRNIRKYMKRVSKGQFALFEFVKKFYPDATLEYPVKVTSKKTIWLDIAVVSRKLNLEYDGQFWHQLDEQKQRDNSRDEFLRNQGWKIIRVKEGQDLSCVTI